MSPWFRRKPPSEERPQLVNPEPERERRRAYRQAGEIRAQLVPQAGRPTDITVLNLSPTGLAFAGSERVQADQDVCIRFTTPPDSPVVYTATVRARSQWASSSSRRGEPWSCGATFQPMTLTQHLNLIRFFLEHFGLRFAGPGDKRRQVRLGFNKPVQVVVRIETTRKMIEGEVKNLSVDGIGFICAERLEPSTRLTVSLRAGSRESIPLRGIVVHTRKLGDGRFQIGVLTNLTNDADRAMLTEILVSAGRKVFDERESEPFQEEMVTGKRTARHDDDSDDVLRPSTGESDKRSAPPQMHRVIEGWRPPWEREGRAPGVDELPPEESAKPTPPPSHAQGSARRPDPFPAPPRAGALPPAGLSAEVDHLDGAADEDDDEPFSWGGTASAPPAPAPAPAAEQEEEDPLEAWARSVNLSPPAAPAEEVSSPWTAPLDARETAPGEDRRGPARPVPADPPAPGTREREWPTLQRLGPLVPPARGDQAATGSRGRHPDPAQATWEADDVPPTMSLGPLVPPARSDRERDFPRERRSGPGRPAREVDETPPTIHLGPLVPPPGTGPRSSPPRAHGTRPPESRSAHEVPPHSWVPTPTPEEPDSSEDDCPPTVQLGPLVPPQPSDQRSASTRRPSREPAASGESRTTRPWSSTRTSSTPGAQAEKAGSSGAVGDAPPIRKDGAQSALPWRRGQEPPPAAAPISPPKPASAFRAWNLTNRSSGPPAEEDDSPAAGSDATFQAWKPAGSTPEPPRKGKNPPSASPGSTFRPWKPGGQEPERT